MVDMRCSFGRRGTGELLASERFVPRKADITFSPNRRIDRMRSLSGKSGKLNSPIKVLNRPDSAAA